MKHVGVITINYNHSKETLECVETILKSDYKAFNVYVVDNGSDMEDYEKLKEVLVDPRVELIRLKDNVGYVGGVNAGLEHVCKSSADLFLIMNNDTLIDVKAISALVECSNKYQNKAIITGKVYNIDEPDTLQYVGQWCKDKRKLDYPPYVKGGKEIDVGQYDEERELGMSDDIYWLLPRTIFDIVGYYSTDFFLYGEQNDYALRAINNGYKLIFTPKAKLWHYHHLTTSGGDLKSFKVFYWRSFAYLLLSFKHLSTLSFLRVFFKYAFKNSYKRVMLLVFKKEKYSREKVKSLAIFYFMIWIVGNRKPNDGFNPF